MLSAHLIWYLCYKSLLPPHANIIIMKMRLLFLETLKILLTCTYHVLPHYNFGYGSRNVRTENCELKMCHRQNHFKDEF